MHWNPIPPVDKSKQQSRSIAEIPMQNLVVYVAHGDRSRRSVIEATLQKMGHRVGLCTSAGHELLMRCETEPPDIVIVGHRLEDMSYFETLNQLGEQNLCAAIAIVPKDEVETAKTRVHDRLTGILAEPATDLQMRPAMYVAFRRFNQCQSLRDRIAELRNEIYNQS